LVAAQKEFWDADQATLLQLSQQFADLIVENGLPGSGHTSPNSPIFNFIKDYVTEEQFTAVQALLDAARIVPQSIAAPSSISELNPAKMEQQVNQDKAPAEQQLSRKDSMTVDYRWLFVLLALLIIIGMVRGARSPVSSKRE
jgi:cobaltochelatase CobN